MAFEDKDLDVLQNIEFAIVSVYRERSGVSDYDVMGALDAVIGYYRAESRGHAHKEVVLDAEEKALFERVKKMCEWRLGRAELPDGAQEIQGYEKSLDDVLACLRKVRRSVDKWNKRGGTQGYLTFVSQYV